MTSKLLMKIETTKNNTYKTMIYINMKKKRININNINGHNRINKINNIF
jgi:hypothetical protein